MKFRNMRSLLRFLVATQDHLTVPPPLHSNLQSLLGITNKSLDTYTIFFIQFGVQAPDSGNEEAIQFVCNACENCTNLTMICTK